MFTPMIGKTKELQIPLVKLLLLFLKSVTLRDLTRTSYNLMGVFIYVSNVHVMQHLGLFCVCC